MKQRSGGLVILIISIIAGLLAALLSVSFLRGMARTTNVLVATQEIQPFTPLKPEMFTLQQLPGAAVPADAVTELAQIRDRYARTLLLPGTALRSGHLATGAGRSGSLAAILTETGKPGTRALAIPIDDATGVGGTLQVGDKVDIVAAVKVDRQNAPSTQFSKIIARAVPVLHRTYEENSNRGTVVVQLTPTQAEEVAYALVAGKIYLATNPYTAAADAEAEKTTGVTPDRFMERHIGR